MQVNCEMHVLFLSWSCVVCGDYFYTFTLGVIHACTSLSNTRHVDSVGIISSIIVIIKYCSLASHWKSENPSAVLFRLIVLCSYKQYWITFKSLENKVPPVFILFIIMSVTVQQCNADAVVYVLDVRLLAETGGINVNMQATQNVRYYMNQR